MTSCPDCLSLSANIKYLLHTSKQCPMKGASSADEQCGAKHVARLRICDNPFHSQPYPQHNITPSPAQQGQITHFF